MKNILQVVNSILLLGAVLLLFLIYQKLPHIPTLKDYHETIRIEDREERRSKLGQMPHMHISGSVDVTGNVDANITGSDGAIEVEGSIDCY